MSETKVAAEMRTENCVVTLHVGGDVEPRYTKIHKLIKIIGFILYKSLTIILIHLPNRNLGVQCMELETYFRSKIPMQTLCWTKERSFLL